MTSTLYFTPNRASAKSKTLDRLRRLLEKAGLPERIKHDDLVALKLSFGERGNVGFIHPVYVRTVVEMVKEAGGRPVLMDSNTLYRGFRNNGHDSLVTALQNGFSFATVGAPLVMLDGLRGLEHRPVAIDGEIYDEVKIGSGILDADVVLSLAHFKGHMLSGIGGQIKNLSMGGAPRSGKQMMHSDVLPEVSTGECSGCATCMEWCPEGAISMETAENERGRVAVIDTQVCIGCGECVVTCTTGAIAVRLSGESDRIQKKMAEFALGVVAGRQDRFFGVNFVLNVTPDCDCTPWSDAPLIPDIGIVAGLDPVALDQCSYDLCNKQRGLPGTALGEEGVDAPDKFAAVHGGVDGTIQLEHGRRIGLGVREYELREVGRKVE